MLVFYTSSKNSQKVENFFIIIFPTMYSFFSNIILTFRILIVTSVDKDKASCVNGKIKKN